MYFSVATNFDNDLIDQIKAMNVTELYGKLTRDFVGGGRSSYMLRKTSAKKLIKHIQYAKKNGLGFNYLLNAACLSNQETTTSGKKKIYDLLDFVSEIGATSTTVSNPLLLKIIKSSFPHLKVRISVFAQVDHILKAKFWEENGADVICLDSLTVNRDFEALRGLRKSVKCDLELLANGNCSQSCSLSHTHMNLLAHSSQTTDINNGFVIDHCFLECTKRKLENKVNFIRSDWIRPEDVHHYCELGFNRFKIVERDLPTDVMVKRVQAYFNQRYDGNLIDLIRPYGQNDNHNDLKTRSNNFFRSIHVFRHLFNPTKTNVFKLLPLIKFSRASGMLAPLQEQTISIDNRQLDGFLEFIKSNNCRYKDCEQCKYCHTIANNVVTIRDDYLYSSLEYYKKINPFLYTI